MCDLPEPIAEAGNQSDTGTQRALRVSALTKPGE
jgi:hypothetical protein